MANAGCHIQQDEGTAGPLDKALSPGKMSVASAVWSYAPPREMSTLKAVCKQSRLLAAVMSKNEQLSQLTSTRRLSAYAAGTRFGPACRPASVWQRLQCLTVCNIDSSGMHAVQHELLQKQLSSRPYLAVQRKTCSHCSAAVRLDDGKLAPCSAFIGKASCRKRKAYFKDL